MENFATYNASWFRQFFPYQWGTELSLVLGFTPIDKKKQWDYRDS